MHCILVMDYRMVAYMHGIVVTSATEKGQAAEQGDRLGCA